LEQIAEELCDLSEDLEEMEAQLVALREAEEETAKNPAKASTAKSSTNPQAPAITRADLEALGEPVVKILDGLGISKPLKRLSMQMSELSGGWRMRAVLAQALVHLDSIDVLLLDEPTNHC
jgi:ATPase subunit of ABC transporter with duplicated ATPase domains